MANVKITELTELSAANLADADVLPIVDVGADQTKKVTIASIQSLSDANDFVTFTRLQANINLVQDNVGSLTSDLTIRGDNASDDTVTLGSETLTFLGDSGLTSTVSANAVTFDLDDTTVTPGTYGGKIGTVSNVPVITIDAQGRITAASNSEVSIDFSTLEGNVNTVSSNVDAVQARLDTNVTAFTNEDAALQARIAANADVAASNDFITFTRLNANVNLVQDNVAAQNSYITTNFTTLLLTDSVQDNVASAEANVLAVETRRADNVFFTLNLTGQPQANIILNDANVEPASNNTYSLGAPDKVWKDVFIGPGSLKLGDVTISALGAEGITITGESGDQANVTTPNQGGVANVSAELDGLQSRLSTNVIAFTNEDAALQARITANNQTAASNDFVTFTRLNANVDVVQDNVATNATDITAVETRRAANVTIRDNEDTALQARIAANAAESASNDFITFTRLNANVNVVQDNVAINATDIAAVEARRVANTDTPENSAAAVETRRVANIAGAVSTITTADLTASRAVVSDGSGKIAVSAVTATEIGHLDGVTSAIQDQFDTVTVNLNTLDANADAIETRRAANLVSAVFTNDVTISGNLIVTGAQVDLGVQTATIQNNMIELSAELGPTDTPSTDSGLLINRGNQGNVFIGKSIAEDGVIFVHTLSSDTNSTIAIDEFMDAHANAFHAAANPNLGRVHFGLKTAEDTGFIFDDSAANLNFVADGAYKANIHFDGTVNSQNAIIAPTIFSGEVELRANDFATYTTLNANIDLVQDNVATNATDITAVETRRTNNIAGAVSTITTSDLTASRALVSDGSGKVAVSDVTATELGHLDGVTSAIQTQLNNKISTADSASNDFITFTRVNANVNVVQDNVATNATDIAAVETRRTNNIAGAVSTITTSDLTASRALVSDGSGKVAVSAVTATEIGHLDGVSSAIQTQLNSKIATTASASNDFVTFTRLDANIDVVSSNATAFEARRTANIAGAVSSITTSDLTASRALVSDGSGKVAVSAVTATELGYLDGVTSAIQTQLNGKQATITGAATTIDDTNLTASRALVSDGSGKVAVSAVTSTELGRLDGVTSDIQTQLNAKLESVATGDIDDNAVTVGKLAATLDLGTL